MVFSSILYDCYNQIKIRGKTKQNKYIIMQQTNKHYSKIMIIKSR